MLCSRSRFRSCSQGCILAYHVPQIIPSDTNACICTHSLHSSVVRMLSWGKCKWCRKWVKNPEVIIEEYVLLHHNNYVLGSHIPVPPYCQPNIYVLCDACLDMKQQGLEPPWRPNNIDKCAKMLDLSLPKSITNLGTTTRTIAEFVASHSVP